MIAILFTTLVHAQSPRYLTDSQKWGLNDDNGIRPSVHWGPGAFQKFKQMGVGWVRYWFYWDLTQRDNVNPIDWSSVDIEISDITSQGLQVYGDIMWAPRFATQGTPAYIEWNCMYTDQTHLGQYNPNAPGCGNIKPDVAAFQNYVRQAVARYGDRIKYWSFWNEPDYPVFWHAWPVGRGYDTTSDADLVPQSLRMEEWINNILIPGAEAARSVNSNVFIVGPEASNSDGLQQVLDADETYASTHNGQRILDVISFHQYDFEFRQERAQGVLDGLDNYIQPGGALTHRDGRPVWVTESWASLPYNPQGYSQGSYTQSVSIEIPALLAGIEQRSWIDRFFFYGSKSLNSLSAPMTGPSNPIWGGEHAFLDVNNLEMPTFPVAKRFLTRYQGCFTDDAARALPVQLMDGATVEQCIQAAANVGYAYAALQWYGQCFAGNNLGYSQVSDSECNTPCSSDSTEACGGGWRNSIYRVIPSAANQRIYEGCYTDDSVRALPVQLFWGDGTLDSCVQAASNAGYKFAGLQWYGECYAGNNRAYQLTAESECNTPCNNKRGDTCGGAWRNSIWSTGK
jgi:hypothetical protein